MALSDFVSAEVEPVLRTIRGRTVKFFPIKTLALLSLRKPLQNLSTSVMRLIYNFQIEAGKQEEISRKGEDFDRVITQMPMDPRTSEAHMVARDKAVRALVDLVLDKADGAHVFAKLILASAREEFDKNDKPEHLVDQLDADIFVELVIGACLASKGIFGDFGAEALEWLQNRAKLTMGASAASAQETSPDDKPKSDDESNENESQTPVHPGPTPTP